MSKASCWPLRGRFARESTARSRSSSSCSTNTGPRSTSATRSSTTTTSSGGSRRLGAVFVDHEDEIPRRCDLRALRAWCRAGGEGELRAPRPRVVDAVCPLVSKVHAEARRYADSGHLVALVGHADHVEVIGTRGERPDATVVIESPEDAAKLDSGGKPIAVITQTTLSLDDVAETVDALASASGSEAAGCRRHLLRDAEPPGRGQGDGEQGATLILVIGSETSSNARRLVEVAELHGATALIDGESGIDPGAARRPRDGRPDRRRFDARGARRGRPARLASFGYDELGEVEVARENVSFRLPREVTARGMTSVEVPYSIASALPSLTVLDITNEIRRELAAGPRERDRVRLTPRRGRARARAGAGVAASSPTSRSCSPGSCPRRSASGSGCSACCSAHAASRSRSPAVTSVSASGSGFCCSASTALRSRAGT